MKDFLFTFFFLLLSTILCAQSKYTISGYITDINNGESIVGANIYCKNLNVGVTSNTYGFYSLTMPEGVHEISFSFMGYKPENQNFKLNSSIVYTLN